LPWRVRGELRPLWPGFGNWRQPAFPFASHGHDGQKVLRIELTKRKSPALGCFCHGFFPLSRHPGWR
jgi:hypothetical protein